MMRRFWQHDDTRGRGSATRLVPLLSLVLVLLSGCQRGRAPKPHLLVVGNSITRHGPREEIGWAYDWGMAATEQHRDWVHLVLSQMPTDSELSLVHCTAPNLVSQVSAIEARVASSQATVVVVQVGDNLSAGDANDETLLEPVARLLQAADAHSAKVVVGIWGGDDLRDQLLQQAADDAGAMFVPIHDLANLPGHRAWEQGVFEHPDVGWHPSDDGMAAIAERVASALGYSE